MGTYDDILSGKPNKGAYDDIINPPKSLLQSANDAITGIAGKVMGNNGAVPIPQDQIDQTGKAKAAADDQAQQQRVEALRGDLHAPDEGAIGRYGKSIAGGFLGALAQPAEYIGRRAGIKPLEDLGQSGQEYSAALQPKDPGFGDMLASGAGSLASFLVPGAIVGKVTKGAALAGRVGELAASRLGQLAGAGVASGAETLGNAQQTYEDALKNSGNPEYSEGQGTKDAIANLPLNFIADKIGFFGGAQHRAANLAFKEAIAGGATKEAAELAAVDAAKAVAAPIAKDVGAGAASEFAQEGGQQVLQNVFAGNPVGDQVAENAVVGGILGGAAGGIHGGIVKRGFNQAPTDASGVESPPESIQQQPAIQPDVQTPPVIRDATGQISGHPEDVAAQVAAAQPDAGPLTKAAGVAATPQFYGEPTATEQARLNETLSQVAGDNAAQQKAAAIAQEQQEQAIREADDRNAAAAQQQSEQQRRSMLDTILADNDVRDPVGKFAAELKRAGYQGEHSLPTKDEMGRVKRFQDVQSAIEQESVAEGTPNEMDVSNLVPEKKVAGTATAPAQQIKLPDDLIPAANAAKALKDGPTAFFQALKKFTKDPGQRKSLMQAYKAYEPASAQTPATAQQADSVAPATPSAPESQSARRDSEQSSVTPRSVESSAEGVAPAASAVAPALQSTPETTADTTPLSPASSLPTSSSASSSASSEPQSVPTQSSPVSTQSQESQPSSTVRESVGNSQETSGVRSGESGAGVSTATAGSDTGSNVSAATDPALRAAHESLVRAKSQTTAIQRRVIDATATIAKSIREGTANLGTALAKSLRTKSEQIARWDPKAAAAVNVLADHVDAKIRPAKVVKETKTAIPKRPKETRTPGMANNASLKREFQRLGIEKQFIRDITGEKKGHRTKSMPGTFRDNGMSIDDWGIKLVEDGWLAPESQSEVGNEDLRASTADVHNFIRRVLNGEEVHKVGDLGEELNRKADLAHSEWIERQAASLADDLSQNEVADLVDSGLTREQNEQNFDAAKELAGLSDDAKESILERAAIQADNGKNYAEAVRALATEERARPKNSEGNRDFALQAQTDADLASREEASRLTAQQESATAKTADEKAKADAQGKDFGLTGSDRAADSNPGQKDLLGRQGEAKPQNLDKPLAEQARAGAGAKPLLQTIVLKSANALNKPIARKLLSMDLKTKVKAGAVEDFDPADLPKNVAAKDLSAMYDPNTDTITLFNSLGVEHDVIHELTHAATYRALRSGGMAALQMKKLYEHVKSFGTFEKSYGLESVDEFVAEAFSNPKFQEELKGIPATQVGLKSAWDWFVKAVRNALGLSADSHNALSQVLEIGSRLMDEEKSIRDEQKALLAKSFGAPLGNVKEAVTAKMNEKPDTRPDWLKGMSQATQEAAKKAGLWTTPKTLQERFDETRKDLAKRLTQGIFDQFAPLKDLDYKSYVLARMSKSADSPLEAMMYYGKPIVDKDGAIDIQHEKGGLIGVLQKLGGETDQFMAWIAGNRAAQLKTEGKENLFTDEDISALKDLNQGKMADGKPRAMLYAEVHKEFNAYGKAVLDIAEADGTISKEDRAVWEKDFYVPFYRQLEDEKVSGPRNAGGLTNQYAFKKLKGGTENLSDLFGNTLRNWSHILNASMKNRAASEALQAAQKAGVATPISAAEKGSVFVLEDGKKQHYAVSDPLILDAITALDSSKLKGAGIDVASKFKHYLTLGVTISPSFRVRNLIRDQIQAAGTTPVGMNVMSNLVQGWKGMHKDSPEYARMVAGGAFMHFGTTLESDRGAVIKRLIDKGVDASSILDDKNKVRAALESAWHWWEDVGAKSENVTRAAIYNRLIGQGKSHLEASFEARDSMDFSMQGAYPAVRLLTQVVPFMNARLQGLYKLSRDGITPTSRVLYNTVTGNPIAATDKQKALRFSAVTGAVIMASLALMLAYRGDKDWEQREEFDRDNFWWFKVGDKSFRIPKPFEIGALASVTERGLEAMLDGLDEEARRRFLARLGSVVMDNLSMNPTPQLIKPLVDLYANKDSFTGRPIESAGMEKLSPSERIGPSTSAVAQALGKPGILSPVQIDELIQGYFGWLGAHAVMTADYALRPAMGLPGKPAPRVDDTFVIGDWVKQLPAEQSRFVSQFYDQGKQIQQLFADVRQFEQLGQMDKAQKLLTESGNKIALHQLESATSRELGKINQRIRYVQMRTGDEDQKRTDLDRLYQLRNKLAETAENARVGRTGR